MATIQDNEKSQFEEREHHPDQIMEKDANELELARTNTTVVLGTTNLYVKGQLKCIPMPTGDPKDPLNLPGWRKFMAIFSLCCFASFSFIAVQVVGPLLPVLVVEYASTGSSSFPGGSGGGSFPSGGFNPGATATGGGVIMATGASSAFGGFPTGSFSSAGAVTSSFMIPSTGASYPASTGAPVATAIDPNPLNALAAIPGAPPLWRVNLLSSLPLLLIGLSNYFLTPLSIVFGRRPLMILCSALTWVCCIWASRTTTLDQHIAARCIHAIGTGAAESLVTLIVQDLTFIHQRNRAIGIIWASQGLVTLAIGVGSTYIVTNLSWRWIYYIIAIFSGLTWLMIIAFVPETRWIRSNQELKGESADCPADEARSPLNYERYGGRTFASNYGLFYGGVHWAAGVTAMKEIFLCGFFPNVFIIILLNSAFIGISLGSSQTASPVLVAPPYNWPFSSVGLSVIPTFIASFFVYGIGSEGSDRLANWITKRRNGKREPEVHLYNLIFPLFCGILGCILFGLGGSYQSMIHWSGFLFGTGILNFAFLTVNIVGSVYCIECFPSWAGPVLVNITSFRNLLGFAISFGITDWVTARGYMGCFGIFAGLIGLLSLGVPLLFVYGKGWRKRVDNTVKKTGHSD